ncbi:phytanoyl-CoA dioxygenase family protein [Sphaerisporangium sp. NPDC051011]|uniref:phytanoyl-CoA dioxygenase family protein n=1 Tax=Sphaerisporangium sp. NPDC051011 TaxID=3155792 RepID=UPI0033E9C5FC
MTIEEAFADRGYVVIRGVLDAGEVERARKVCADNLTGTGEAEMMTSDFLATPELAEIPLRERIVSVARRLLGEHPVLYPNCTARQNVYVPWHVDSTFVGPGHEYVWEPGFTHVQAGLYLQDNDPETGGAIDVIRGSHLMSFDGYGRTRPEYEVPARTLAASSLRETVDMRAGDVVMWHGRLMHASTVARREQERPKFGVFFSYGRNDLGDNHRFMSQFGHGKVRTVDGVSRVIPRLDEISRLRYPADFPAWFVSAADGAGVVVSTP